HAVVANDLYISVEDRRGDVIGLAEGEEANLTTVDQLYTVAYNSTRETPIRFNERGVQLDAAVNAAAATYVTYVGAIKVADTTDPTNLNRLDTKIRWMDFDADGELIAVDSSTQGPGLVDPTSLDRRLIQVDVDDPSRK